MAPGGESASPSFVPQGALRRAQRPRQAGGVLPGAPLWRDPSRDFSHGGVHSGGVAHRCSVNLWPWAINPRNPSGDAGEKRCAPRHPQYDVKPERPLSWGSKNTVKPVAVEAGAYKTVQKET